MSSTMTDRAPAIAVAPEVISVSPFRCRMWAGHERLEDQISEQSCRDEIASVLSRGQLLPVLGRGLKHDATHDFELVYGARRLFVARHLNIPLRMQVRDLSDREATIALDVENRLRKDFSPYERGRGFNAWLRAGLFPSQEELARTLNISASQVSRLRKLAQLPTVIVNAFSTPVDICETWGCDLMDLWEHPDKRRIVTARARSIAKEHPRPAAAMVYQRLTLPSLARARAESALGAGPHDEVVKDNRGNPLFRISIRRKDVAILLPATLLSNAALSEIKRQVSLVLQHARSQLPDATVKSAPRTTMNAAISTLNGRADTNLSA
jgi:ParB family transcriptional regulator, chromosome partitioning protein